MAVGRKQTEKMQQKMNELIPLLCAFPNGLTRRQIRKKLAVSDSMFDKILYNMAEYPIGYDNRLDDNYYWVGL